jgi:stearoyl-CoA desaturase (delta-9 desaturase)
MNPHFLKITLPNWILSVIAVVVLCVDFRYLDVLYAVLGFYVLGIFGASIGFHRYLTHMSFKTTKFWHWAMIAAGSLTGMGSPIFWVALHKYHHTHPDQPSDVHSPRNGIWRAFLGWQLGHLQPIQSMANRFMYADPLIKLIHRQYYKLYWGIVLLLYLVNWRFALFFMSLGGFMILSLFENFGNVALHHKRMGYRNYELEDDSRNIWWYSMLTLGGGYHNNHHRWPGRYRFGEKWFEFDLGARFIELIKT